jgi:hypothetical protein
MLNLTNTTAPKLLLSATNSSSSFSLSSFFSSSTSLQFFSSTEFTSSFMNSSFSDFTFAPPAEVKKLSEDTVGNTADIDPFNSPQVQPTDEQTDSISHTARVSCY